VVLDRPIAPTISNDFGSMLLISLCVFCLSSCVSVVQANASNNLAVSILCPAVQGNNEVSMWDMETGDRKFTLWASSTPPLSEMQVSMCVCVCVFDVILFACVCLGVRWMALYCCCGREMKGLESPK
jgi:hypothetical protein